MPIEGDVCQLKMGINDSDFMMLKNVSVIFHAAASVRYVFFRSTLSAVLSRWNVWLIENFVSGFLLKNKL